MRFLTVEPDPMQKGWFQLTLIHGASDGSTPTVKIIRLTLNELSELGGTIPDLLDAHNDI